MGNKWKRSAYAQNVLLLILLALSPCGVCSQPTYFYSRYKAAFPEAMADCAAVGGRLATLNTPTKWSFITTRMYGQWFSLITFLWIGLDDYQRLYNFKWQDGNPLVWAPWGQNQPSRQQYENCGCIYLSRLFNAKCYGKNYFLCEVYRASPEAQENRDKLSCWVANDLLRPAEGEEAESIGEVKCPRNKLYFSPTHRLNAKTWTEADAYCKEANSQLASAFTEEEQSIIDRFRNVKGLGDTWIRGTDVVVEGEYVWAHGEPFTWPDFLTVSKPADDTSKNCLVSTQTLNWDARNCLNKYQVLCEMDIEMRPSGHSCYWFVPPNTWPNTLLSCQQGGGTLITLNDVRQFERSTTLFGVNNHYFLGMSDVDNDHNFQWTDGSIMLWSWWLPTQPSNDNGYQPYGGIWSNYQYVDLKSSEQLTGMCEKHVDGLMNAGVKHNDGSIDVHCHDHCFFADGTTSKFWTCNKISERLEGCNCPERWFTEERWLTEMNTSFLFDKNTSSCLDLSDVTSVLTLRQQFPFIREFNVDVHLPADLENHRSTIVRVFTSDYVYKTELPNTCLNAVQYRKCLHFDNFRYNCICENPCALTVKISFISNKEIVNKQRKVCEIQF